jgi:competence protein ComEA
MNALLTKRVPIAWLLLALILAAFSGIIGLAFLSAPPSNTVVITAPTPAATSAADNGLVLPPTHSAPGPGTAGTRPTRTPNAGSTVAAPASTPPAVSQVLDTMGTPPAQSTSAPLATGTSSSDAPQTIAVYVTGAVQKPGVYRLPPGSRAMDALNAAGGPAGNADLDQVNLAARVADEDHLSVPKAGDTPVPGSTKGEPGTSVPAGATPSTVARPTASSKPATSTKPNPSLNGKININSASAQELEALPGIGPALAQRIVTFRQQNGPFGTIDDIKLVPGIKDALFSKVRAYITAGP